jgi:hypothetical protein
MKASDALGLTLAWMCTCGSTSALQLLFGLTQTPVCDFLSFCTLILILALQQISDALIKLPSDKDLSCYQDAVVCLCPKLEGVWCTMDGLKLLLECAGDSDVQNRYYNGWTYDHYLSAVLEFCSDGPNELVIHREAT